jgi:hypothetical protein
LGLLESFFFWPSLPDIFCVLVGGADARGGADALGSFVLSVKKDYLPRTVNPTFRQHCDVTYVRGVHVVCVSVLHCSRA